MHKRTRLMVLAGGQSDEHEVSIISARSVVAAAMQTRLDAQVRVIARDGKWLGAAAGQEALQAGRALKGEHNALAACAQVECDVIFPLLHGPFGEDGTVQGMLELAHMPYVGSGVLASSLCMDKPLTKDVLKAHGIEQVDYRLVRREHFTAHPAAEIERVLGLSGPWFVKPANLGSSVGISKATDAASLRGALETAFRYDRRAIVEQAVMQRRELEVAILGNDQPEASPVGEITYDADFYDYETKYTDGRAALHIPAVVPPDVATRLQNLARRAFEILDCAGFARVDFFYDEKNDRILLNEVNTIPGFTPYSMFPQLWQAAGLSYPEIIERLVELALQRHGGKAASAA